MRCCWQVILWEKLKQKGQPTCPGRPTMAMCDRAGVGTMSISSSGHSHCTPHEPHIVPNRLDKDGSQRKVSMGTGGRGLHLGMWAAGAPARPRRVWPTHPQTGGPGEDGGCVPWHTGACQPRCHGPASGGDTGPGGSGHTGSSWCGAGPCEYALRGRKPRGEGVTPGLRGCLSAPSQQLAPPAHRTLWLILSDILLWVMGPFVPLTLTC